MTPEAADQRIILSRQTLHRYRAMIDAGQMPHPDTVRMIDGELLILRGIALLHEPKADKIAALIDLWRDLMEKIRTVH